MSGNSRKGASRARTYRVEIPEQGEQVARAYFVNYHPHPINVARLRGDNLGQVVFIRPLKLWRGPPPPELVERRITSHDTAHTGANSLRCDTSVAGICYNRLAVVSYKDMFLRTTLE